MSAPPSDPSKFAVTPQAEPGIVDSPKIDSPRPAARPQRRFLSAAVKPLVSHLNTTAWIIMDVVIAFAAVEFAFFLSPYSKEVLAAEGHLDFLQMAVLYAIIFAVIGHVFGLHDKLIRRGKWNLLAKATLVSILSCLAVAGIAVFFFYLKIGRQVLGVTAALSFLGVAFTRLLAWRLDGSIQYRICLIGNEAFCKTARAVHTSSKQRIETLTLCLSGGPLSPAHAGNFALQADPAASGSFFLQPVEHSFAGFRLEDWTAKQDIDEIVVQTPLRKDLHGPITNCLNNGTVVGNFVEHVESRFSCVPIDEIDVGWFLSQGLHPYYHLFKRFTDLLLAGAGLILASPLVLIAVAAIKLESKGPAFYTQTRVGLRSRKFQIHKLRSMRQDAETDGAQWASTGDPRVTRVGRILRKTRLDEVPQFWNIIKGEMAFIGPRPERPEFVDKLVEKLPFYAQRHLVKPGLTGWAQIHLSYGSSVDDAMDKLRYDLYYVKHCRLELDLHILFRTVGTIMKGAR